MACRDIKAATLPALATKTNRTRLRLVLMGKPHTLAIIRSRVRMMHYPSAVHAGLL